MKKIYIILFFVLGSMISSGSPPDSPEGDRFRVSPVIDTFPSIYEMIDMVDTTMITAEIYHLQQFVTRFCTKQGAFDAQDFIKGQFESFGLPVELQDFTIWVGESSDNVIATLTGEVAPDEYVIIGAHYDSYATMTNAPGADDNASGTCGVIEAARILSQYHFEKSIIFCAFSGEELGLYGSEAYAARCEQEGMSIPGYFNMDMIGYQEPGTPVHTDIIAPPFADPLVQYYKDVARLYLPGFPVHNGYLTSGDSDHTSFNNHGYMGIFPFEDDTLYSHYIHTVDDLVGLSYNSPLLAMKLTQAGIAAVAEMAVPIDHTGIGETTGVETAARIYPNPAGDFVSVECREGSPVTAGIFSLTGSLLLSKEFTGYTKIDISSLSSGPYILRLSGKDLLVNKKLIVH